MTQEIFMSDTEEEERHYPTILSEEEDDFDPPMVPSNLPTPLKPTPSTPASRRLNRRFSTTGSMATIRVKRRAQLADKLRDIFELEGIVEVVAGKRCSLSHPPCCTDHVLLRNPVLATAISVYVVPLVCRNLAKPPKCSRDTCTSRTPTFVSLPTCRPERYSILFYLQIPP